MIQILCCTCE